MPAMRRAAMRDGPDRRRQLLQQAVVERREFDAASIEAIELADLAAAERAKDVRQSVIPADLRHLVIPGIRIVAVESKIAMLEGRGIALHAMRAQPPHPASNPCIRGRHDAALCRRDGLDRMRGEA